jgi:hypothetical protein
MNNIISHLYFFTMKRAMYQSTFFLLISALFICGCRHITSEPYPSFVISTIPQEKLPKPVKDAFDRSYPLASISKVETRSFKGKIDLYHISFRTGTGISEDTAFTPDGSRVTESGNFPPTE